MEGKIEKVNIYVYRRVKNITETVTALASIVYSCLENIVYHV